MLLFQNHDEIIIIDSLQYKQLHSAQCRLWTGYTEVFELEIKRSQNTF